MCSPASAGSGRDLLRPFDANTIPQPPGEQHWFGTDNFGRDIFTRVLYGTRISLPMGLISVGLALGISLVSGLLAGYYGGWTDAFVMRAVDVMLAFPGLLLALAIVATLGPSLENAMIAVGLSAAPTFMRVVRAGVLSAREFDYVEAARAVGHHTARTDDSVADDAGVGTIAT